MRPNAMLSLAKITSAACRTWPLLSLALTLGSLVAVGGDSPVATAAGVSKKSSVGWDLHVTLPESPVWDRWFESEKEGPPQFTELRPQDLLGTNREALLAALGLWIYGPSPALPEFAPMLLEGSYTGHECGHITLRVGGSGAADAPVQLETAHPKGSGQPSPILHPPTSPGRVLLLCGPTDLTLSEAAARGWVAVRMAFTNAGSAPATNVSMLPEIPTIAHEAWRIRRVINFLVIQPGVPPSRVVLVGQGFGAKVALWAAAQDERATAVLAVDSGPGGACPFGLWTEAEFGPGIEIVTREHSGWFSPGLRFFTGREHRLPVDAPALLACLAPRPTLIATALNNPKESAWAVEQAWRAAMPCFDRAGAEAALALDIRAGDGRASASDWDRWLDWLEARLAGETPAVSAVSGPRFPTYDGWLKAGGTPLDPQDFAPRGPMDLLVSTNGDWIQTPEAWRERAAALKATVREALGKPTPSDDSSQRTLPPAAVAPGAGSLPTWLAQEPLDIHSGLSGRIFYRTNIVGTDRRLPALVWLHPWSVPTGHEAAAFRKEQPWLALTRSGSVVLTFDLIGCGSRVEEGLNFHRRNPGGSLLGQMVQDAQDAVSALAQHPHVDPGQVFLLGCGPGGVVALHAAALDDRVAGVLSVGGFPPMRSITPGEPNSALAGLALQPSLLPQLGRFIDWEPHLPHDFTDLLALVAPRPTLIVVPGVNRFASVEDIRTAVEAARPVYALLGNPDALVLQIKDDYHHFTPDQVWCLCNDDAQR